jgi:hypothetical protein
MVRCMHHNKSPRHFHARRHRLDDFQPVLPPQITMSLTTDILTWRILRQKIAKKDLLSPYPSRPLAHFRQYRFPRRAAWRRHQHC